MSLHYFLARAKGVCGGLVDGNETVAVAPAQLSFHHPLHLAGHSCVCRSKGVMHVGVNNTIFW